MSSYVSFTGRGSQQLQQQQPPPQHQGGGVEALERKLQEREFHLAELIDEVVYSEGVAVEAEKQRDDCQRELDAATSCLENVLAYAARLEQDVVIPSLTDLNVLLRKRDDLAAARRRGVTSAELLPSRMLTPQFRKVLDQLRAPAPPVAEALQRRQDALSMAQQRDAVATDPEDAFVVAESLIASRQQLSALVADSRRRMQATRDGGANGPASPLSPMSTSGAGDGAVAAELRRELEETKGVLQRTREERDTLSHQLQDNAGSPATFSMLQGQWHTERSTLQQRVRDLESALDEGRTERGGLGAQIEAMTEEVEQAKQERVLMNDEIRRLRDAHVQHASERTSSRSERSAGFGRSETFGSAEHDLRLELDRVVREHSTHVTTLQNEIANLRSEAQAARRDRGMEEGHSQQLEQLRRNNEQLRREISKLQQQMASSSRREGGGEGSLALESKVRGLEGTITQLNEELGTVDRRIADVERQHQDEKKKIVTSFDAERRQYQLEREECDALVLKMTSELEFLVRENASLRNGNTSLGSGAGGHTPTPSRGYDRR